jgi:phosphoribosylaminoimidazole-succinocarboxamide synthase
MTRERIEGSLDLVFEGLPEKAALGLPVCRGKVRDLVQGERLQLLVASDRVCAFGRALCAVPYKGELLTRTSAFWFKATEDIVPNHVVAGPGEMPGVGRAFLARKADMLPVEVVVRGYLTGSAWRDYLADRPVAGVRLPEGLKMNEKFPVPLVTPSVKESSGHIRSVSRDDIVMGGQVPEDLWREVEQAALALFRRGQELAARGGLILADASYDFGLVGGKLCLCNAVHTPDSSRYWWAEGYAARYGADEPQRQLEKEPFRSWLAERGFKGDGPAPAIPESVRAETAWRHVQAFETITGEFFEPLGASPQAEAELLARIVGERLLS